MARPTLDDLFSDVIGIIDDSSQTGEDKILRLFNRALYRFANVYVIPDLRKVGQVETVVGANVAPLPSDFHKKLSICYNSTTNKHIRVHNSRPLIDRRIRRMDLVGNIHSVAKDGTNLYYQRKPSVVETLNITYYSLPEDVTNTIPPYIPEDLVDRLFVNFACWFIYAKIEDGLEGDKIDTMYYKNEFNEAMADAKRYFGNEEDEPYVPLDGAAFPNNFNFNSCM